MNDYAQQVLLSITSNSFLLFETICYSHFYQAIYQYRCRRKIQGKNKNSKQQKQQPKAKNKQKQQQQTAKTKFGLQELSSGGIRCIERSLVEK